MSDNNNNSKSSRIRSKDKALVKFVVGVLAIVIAFWLATTISKKADAIESTNKTLSTELNELKSASANQEELKKNLDKMKLDTDYVLDKFPENFTFEKVVEYITKLWKDNYTYGITGMNFANNGDFYTFVDKDGVENSSLGKISSATITVTYVSSYETLKKLVDEINLKLPTRASINSLEMTYDDEDAAIGGNATITVYYGATTRKYEEPKFDVDIKKDHLFR